MLSIVHEIYNIIKTKNNMIEAEETLKQLMETTFARITGEVLSQIDQELTQNKKNEGWTMERKDERTIQFMFGSVTYERALMKDRKGKRSYPLDEYLCFAKYQRYSPLVEVKTAELASEQTYRGTAKTLSEWTAVTMSHQTVGKIVKEVGEVQQKADEALVQELEEAAELPEGKKVDYLYGEADGVFVRSTQKKKQIEVRHAITYEGWDLNGKRVKLTSPYAIMTTKEINRFWQEVQAVTAHRYALSETQVVTGSDGGAGYTPDRFQEAFSQSNKPVLNQIDGYHVQQSLSAAFGVKSHEYKTKAKQALKDRDKENFTKWIDTYESTITDEKHLKRIEQCKKYLLSQWERIFDWREKVADPPENARSLGAIESNQRHISFRMKKRGMHWSKAGCEAMVKVKQGILNNTLRSVYLHFRGRTTRQQRVFQQIVTRAKKNHEQAVTPSVRQGTFALNGPHSSPMGKFVKGMKGYLVG
ncbi:ISLre2 family transposase [Shouchella lonarensis]|uniref:ISLre2 family transposase n=1 Tax=Shouchella lonarensis TaxID=1464122 RepID=A0A1G6PG85_9BACI|nr:Uncharacterised protein family (UPF0236) [Shouchella lonarensis]